MNLAYEIMQSEPHIDAERSPALAECRKCGRRHESVDPQYLGLCYECEDLFFASFQHSMSHTWDREARRRQKEILSTIYSNYDPKRHDAFVGQFQADQEAAALRRYLRNRGL